MVVAKALADQDLDFPESEDDAGFIASRVNELIRAGHLEASGDASNWRFSEVRRVIVMDDTTILYRPVGPEELELLKQSDFTRWPPRLPEQPIFYPVTNERYASEIAEKWNVKDSGYGAVTMFHVRSSFMSRYQIQQVGGSHHTEWWVPAEDLEILNDNIVGRIEVIREFSA
jgi:hypothetical protein